MHLPCSSIILSCPSHKVVSVKSGASHSQTASVVLCGLRIEVRSRGNVHPSISRASRTPSPSASLKQAPSQLYTNPGHPLPCHGQDPSSTVDAALKLQARASVTGINGMDRCLHRMDHQALRSSCIQVNSVFGDTCPMRTLKSSPAIALGVPPG